MGQEGGGEAAAGAVRGVTQGGDSGRIGRLGLSWAVWEGGGVRVN